MVQLLKCSRLNDAMAQWLKQCSKMAQTMTQTYRSRIWLKTFAQNICPNDGSNNWMCPTTSRLFLLLGFASELSWKYHTFVCIQMIPTCHPSTCSYPPQAVIPTWVLPCSCSFFARWVMEFAMAYKRLVAIVVPIVPDTTNVF